MSLPVEHPWPHLKKFFSVVSYDGSSYKFKCELCRVSTKTLSCVKSCNSNLLKHAKAIHPLTVLPTVPSGRRRANVHVTAIEDDSSPTAPKQAARDFPKYISSAQVEDLVVDFVIENSLNFSVVDSRSGQNLFKHIPLQSSSNRTLTTWITVNHIERRFDGWKEAMKRTFESLEYVALTADGWKGCGRCYFGITATWIDPSTLKRESRAIAFRRVIGSLEHGQVASSLQSVIQEFGLQGKVRGVVTDNASNFSKAPNEFGADGHDYQTVDLYDLLFDAMQDIEISLPPHFRCGAHYLNLIGSKDSENALADNSYAKRHASAFSKCQQLWHKQHSSTISSNRIVGHCVEKFVTPCASRWNSTYDAVVSLLQLIDNGAPIAELCRRLGVPAFGVDDIEFLRAYTKVMKSLADHLDVLQRSDASIGYVLPTVVSLKRKYNRLLTDDDAYPCRPLVLAIQDGIEKRYGHIESSALHQVAASLIPRFKMSWTVEPVLRDHVIRRLRASLEPRESCDASVVTNSAQVDDIFDLGGSSQFSIGVEEDCFALFFQRPVKSSLEELLASNMAPIKKLYIRENTTPASSADSERLFHTARAVIDDHQRSGALSDKHFEMQLLLKFNKHYSAFYYS